MSLIDGAPRARLGSSPMPVVVVLPLIALSLLLAWLALFLFLRANESRIVFMTDRTHSSSVPIDGTAFHRVQFPTSDGLSLEGIQLGTTAAWPRSSATSRITATRCSMRSPLIQSCST